MAASREAEHARILKAVEAHQAQEAAAAAERERSDAERGTLELADYREAASAAWLGSGGTRAEFNDAWPELKRRYLTEQADSKLSATERLVEREKDALRASGRYSRM